MPTRTPLVRLEPDDTPPPSSTSVGPEHWVTTWGASPQRTDAQDHPPVPLSNGTLRQKVYVSLGGEQLRLGLSNDFGDGPVAIDGVHVARASSATNSAIDVASDVALTFHGSCSVTIEPGASVKSDPFAFALPEQSVVAVSMRFGAVPNGITGHPGSRTTSYFAHGEALTAQVLSGGTSEHWYYIQSLEVMAPARAAALVTLGDSITDGRGSTTNGNDRWPDALSRRFRENPGTAHIAVVNAGMGGNAVWSGGLGPPARERFDRDVLGTTGVAWVVVLLGVNDIGTSQAGAAENVIAAYREFSVKAHARGVRTFGVPILPFGGSSYDSVDNERARNTVNAWIRTSGAFDAVLDLDVAVAQQKHPGRLRPEFHDGDHLHLNPTGLRAMADAIDLALFVR